jgi:hypothetical protein
MVSILIGIGAGLVSALLFAVAVRGSLLAVVLSVLPSVPILIVALGWSHWAGLIAAVVGGIALALAFKFAAGAIFVVGWGLPAWWLAYLALLGRPRPDGSMEWYPIGHLLLWIGLTVALVTFLGTIAIGGGDYGLYREAGRRVFEAFLHLQTNTPSDTPLPSIRGIAAEDVVNGIVFALPAAVAASLTLVLILNLWLAAKTVAVSQRLPRPWPFLPGAAMPPFAIGLFLGAIAAAFVPGFVGVAGLAIFGGLSMAFAFQGLALVHDTTRGRPARGALLAATYFLAIFIGQVAWPLLALAGIADAAFGLRKRLSSGGAGPRST